MKIFISNMSQEVTENDLKSTFEKFGKVDEIEIIKDWESHQSTGMGFVKMRSKDDGQTAINNLDGSRLKDNIITVHQAHSDQKNREGHSQHGEGKSQFGKNKHGFDTSRSGVRGNR